RHPVAAPPAGVGRGRPLGARGTIPIRPAVPPPRAYSGGRTVRQSRRGGAAAPPGRGMTSSPWRKNEEKPSLGSPGPNPMGRGGEAGCGRRRRKRGLLHRVRVRRSEVEKCGEGRDEFPTRSAESNARTAPSLAGLGGV
ncbi:hypothetical protein THAOC_20607, partial [Thalassiosira oceanica]